MTPDEFVHKCEKGRFTCYQTTEASDLRLEFEYTAFNEDGFGNVYDESHLVEVCPFCGYKVDKIQRDIARKNLMGKSKS
jgi:hypothetical protein